MFISSKGDPMFFFPLELCRKEVKCYKEIYELGRSLKVQAITLLRTLEKGFEAAIAGYMFHKLPEFKCLAQNLATAAEEFEKILGNEIITQFHPNLWKEKYPNFEMWFQRTVESSYHQNYNFVQPTKFSS